MALQGEAALENFSTQPPGERRKGEGGSRRAAYLVMEEQVSK